MRKSIKAHCYFISFVIAIAVCLQACGVAPSIAPPSSAPPANTVVSTTPPATPSPSPATASPSPPSSPSPKPSPAESSPYIANAYTASDGKYIYYFTGDAVRRMDMNGKGDRKLGIKNFYEFVALDANGLYYLVYDEEYVPTEEEEEWQYCLAFNLMFYDAKKQKSQTIKKHLTQAVVFKGRIYMVDHTKHSHIFFYDMADKALRDVTGLPQEYHDSEEIFINAYNDALSLSCGLGSDSREFIISGDTVDIDAEIPQELWEISYEDYADFETDDGGKYRWYYTTRTLCSLAGSGNQKTLLTDVEDVVQAGTKLYVLTFIWRETYWEEGDEDGGGDEAADESIGQESGMPYALYSVSANGVDKIVEGIETSVLGEWIVTDFVAGWFFSFWVEDDGGTACGVLLKQKVG